MNLESFAKLPLRKFAPLFTQIVDKILEDPIKNFIEAPNLINFKPSYAQKVILKVVFQQALDFKSKDFVFLDALDKDDNLIFVRNEMTEVELYEHMTGIKYNLESAVETVINNIDLICGRRSGKTTLAAALSIYCAIVTNWKPYLTKTPFATVLVMSHSKDFSVEVLDIIKQMVDESPILSKLINKNRKQTNTALNLSMPFVVEEEIQQSQVQIKVGAASSKTTRGIAACAVLCDEIAFWNLDDSLKESDAKILTAVEPAMAQFGDKAFLFKLSSPGIRQGVLYNEYQKYVDGKMPEGYAIFKAPTWLMNGIIDHKFLKNKYAYSPDGFMVEYGGEFSDSLSSFIVGSALDLVIEKNINIIAPEEDPDIQYFAALDAAFKEDLFTFTLVAQKGNQVIQCMSHSWAGTKTKPVQAREVAAWIAEATTNYPIDYVGADQFSFQPLKEIFDDEDLTLKEYTFSSTFKKKIYFNLKRLIHGRQISLLDVEAQTKELRELIVEQSPSGAILIHAPRGGHDDHSDCLAIASYLATEGMGEGKFSFDDEEDYPEGDIRMSRDGVSFSAPSVRMLVNSGHLQDNVSDNSDQFGIDSSDGRLKRKELFEGEEEDDFLISF